jgi:hypothetical protein
MCESGIFVGGSLQFCQDTRKDLRFTRKSRGLIAKLPGLLLPMSRSEQGAAAACLAKSPALRHPSGSGELRNRKRRSRGSRRCAHHGRRSTGGAGFRRRADRWSAMVAGAGSPWMAALRCSSDRGKGLMKCGSAR